MKGSNPFIIVLVQRLETGMQHQYQAFIDRLTRNLNIVVAAAPGITQMAQLSGFAPPYFPNWRWGMRLMISKSTGTLAGLCQSTFLL